MVLLHCYGHLCLSDESATFKTVRKKSLVLLAFLSIRGHGVTRTGCADFLWPNLDTAHSLANLRNAIADINHSCGKKQILSRDDVIYASPDVVTDIREILDIQSAIRQRTPVDLESCLSALKPIEGPFLSGYSIADNPGFDDWVFTVQSQIQKAVILVRKHLIVHYVSANQPERALQFALLNREDDLYDESAHRIVLIIHALQGDLQSLSDQYDYCRNIMERLLSEKVDSLTSTLYRQLRKGENRRNRSDLIKLILRETSLPGGALIKSRESKDRDNKLTVFFQKILIRPIWIVLLVLLTSISLLSAIWHGQKDEVIPTVAVLPVQSVLPPGDPVENYSDSVTALLIDQLSEDENLSVQSYSRIIKFSDDHRSTQEIAADLDVSYLIKGTMTFRDGCIDFSFRLIDGNTTELLMNRTLECSSADYYGTVEKIGAEFSKAITSGISPVRRQIISSDDTELISYGDIVVIAGRYHLEEGLSQSEYNRFFQILSEVYAVNTYAAMEYIRNADLYCGYAFLSKQPPDGMIRLLEIAEENILKNKPDSPLIDLSRGIRSLVYEGEIEVAQSSFYQALSLDPGEASVYRWLAALRIASGIPGEAFPPLDRAEEIDPLNPHNRVYRASAFYFSGAYRRVLEYIDNDEQSNRNFQSLTILIAGMACSALGNFEDAQVSFTESLNLGGGALPLAYQAVVFAKTGRRDIAEEIFMEINRGSFRENSRFSHQALIAAGLGKRDLSVRLIEEARIRKEVSYLWIRNDPLLGVYGIRRLTAGAPDVND